MAHKEVFEVPEYAQADIEKIWGGRIRSNELETVLDLYYWAKQMGIVVMQKNQFRKEVAC